MALDPGHLRAVLLRILSEEEYHKVEEYSLSLESETLVPPQSEALSGKEWLRTLRIVEHPDPKAQVRISDLRLAKDIKPLVHGPELELVLGRLKTRPITTERVLRWKWQTLKEYKTLLKKRNDWTEKERKDEKTRVIVVSFAAAAICLFLDLGMPGIREATSHDLHKSIVELAGVIRTLMEDLTKSTEKLTKILAKRGSGRPKDPLIKCYMALSLYRMGRSLEEIAERVGITPAHHDSSTMKRKGSKDLETKVGNIILRGVRVELEWLPQAAKVFANKDDEAIRAKAIVAYREYSQTAAWRWQDTHFLDWDICGREGDDFSYALPSAEGDGGEHRALIQLGSCLEKGIDPLPD